MQTNLKTPEKNYHLQRKKWSNFLKRVLLNETFFIRFCKKNDNYPAYVTEDNTIWINTNLFNSYTLIEQKSIILHEAGHICTGKIKCSAADCEFNAHIWAINTAKKQRWIKILNQLEKDIIDWGTNFTWNENKGRHRIYIKASKKYKEMINENT